MREILFRGKRVDGGEWCYGVPLVEGWSKKTYIASYEYSSLTFIQQIEIIPETVGQFTGLTDKNGKRIFEGDLVRTKYGRICEVVWRETPCFLGFDFEAVPLALKNDGFKMPPTAWDLHFQENLEVIGDIHDNPELL